MMGTARPSVVVLLTIATCSATCSVLTLWIIRAIKRWNGYMQVISSLAMWQFAYDTSMVLIPFRRYSATIESTYIAVRCISGLAATSYTNILASVVAYAVWKRSTYDIDKVLKITKPIIHIVSCAVGLMVSISLAIEESSDFWSYTYGFLRLLSISINLVLYIILTVTLYHRNRNSPKKNDPLEVLVNRFKYYPLVQLISRLAVVIHEAKYGFEYYYENGSGGLRKTISLYLYVITLPSLGILYFIVFLSTSPGAYTTLRNMMNAFCHQDDINIEEVHKGGENRLHQEDQDESSRCSSVNSESSSKRFSCGLDEILLNNDAEAKSRVHWVSTGSGLDINEMMPKGAIDDSFSRYNDYDEDELVREIDKVRSEAI